MDEKSIKRISGDCKREKCYLLTSFCRRDSPGNISVIVPQDYIPKSSQIFVLPSNKVTFLLVFVSFSSRAVWGISSGRPKVKRISFKFDYCCFVWGVHSKCCTEIGSSNSKARHALTRVFIKVSQGFSTAKIIF